MLSCIFYFILVVDEGERLIFAIIRFYIVRIKCKQKQHTACFFYKKILYVFIGPFLKKSQLGKQVLFALAIYRQT